MDYDDPRSGAYVRSHYGVPADPGRRIVATGAAGTIVGFTGLFLLVLRDGDDHWVRIHPTSGVEYLDEVREVTFTLSSDPAETAGLADWLRPYGWYVDRPEQAGPGYVRMRPVSEDELEDGSLIVRAGATIQWDGTVNRYDPPMTIPAEVREGLAERLALPLP
ncbi:hypothetical protein OG689_41905 [Kitasatospora sp. NBC_00240]|uniref:hypothetical protein n=1 Tax=Kitasatospora sp. NBC_00240 TaxID=2903567 RepID=UPI0022580EA6|nr:hypothetical protein [Kitasatospora sp. NBC_00240]MCX5215714.1 hypothetical protein [Kitasatospora sp. NBC_00240]